MKEYSYLSVGGPKIGDKEQLPEDYDREVINKINSIVPYELAWKKAIEYLRDTLEVSY